MSDAPARTNDFEPVNSAAEILTYFNEATKSFSSVTIWVKNEEGVIHSHLVMLADRERTFYSWIAENFDMKGFLEGIQKRGSREFLFSMTLSRANLFFKAHFKTYDSAGLQFDLPTQIYKVQRRKNARFMIPTHHTVKVDFQDPLFEATTQTKRIYDISAGGLAFVTVDTDTVLYPAGLTLKAFHFVVKNQHINTEAEVRHISQLPPVGSEKLIKVGVIFKSLKPHDTDLIASYVFDESRKLFSRLL